MKATAVDAAGHLSQRAERVNSVEVSEKKNRLDFFATGKVDLNIVGVFLGAMDASTSAESFEFRSKQRAHAIPGNFVIAGRFDFDEFSDRVDHCLLAQFEVAETVAP